MHAVAVSSAAMLSGAELVLCALVPKAGTRWQQVHINRTIAEQFLLLKVGEDRTATFERVDQHGLLGPPVTRRLIYSKRNKNYKVEFDFSPARFYPAEGPPILLILALDVRAFRYRTIFPAQAGYLEMSALNSQEASIGKGFRRIITTLDEVEMRWPRACLRNPARASPELGTDPD